MAGGLRQLPDPTPATLGGSTVLYPPRVHIREPIGVGFTTHVGSLPGPGLERPGPGLGGQKQYPKVQQLLESGAGFEPAKSAHIQLLIAAPGIQTRRRAYRMQNATLVAFCVCAPPDKTPGLRREPKPAAPIGWSLGACAPGGDERTRTSIRSQVSHE